MEEKGYNYLMRPLISPGIIFLVIYPLVVGAIYLITKFPPLELKVLAGIYIAMVVLLALLWVYARSKQVYVMEDHLIFRTLLGTKIIGAEDIRRVVFSWTPKGQEVAVVRTRDNSYYLSEFYFPFPELMADLEDFIRFNGVRSNTTDRGYQ